MSGEGGEQLIGSNNLLSHQDMIATFHGIENKLKDILSQDHKP